MSELAALAEAVVEQAAAGEEMEVYVARGRETEVRAFDGAVESLSSATSAGVGVRVLLPGEDEKGGRLGFAWAGSLDGDVVRATVAEARDNAAYATPDPDVVLARPDGVGATTLDLWDPSLEETPTEAKVAMALELERRVRGADPRIRQVDSADYGDEQVEMALASTTGIRAATRRTSAYLSVSALAGEGADTQTGSGFSVGRGPGELRPEAAGEDAVVRATRMLGATKAALGPADRRLRPPRRVHLAVGGLLGPLGRGRGEGPFLLRRSPGRAGGGPHGDPPRRPHRPAGLRRSDLRR